MSDGPRFTPRQAGIAIAAFVIGGVVAVAVERAISETGPMRASETVFQAPAETLEAEEVPRAPVSIVAERVRLPEGFESTRAHGGPTFVFVDFGRITIDIEGEERRYGAGAFYFIGAGEPYTLRVIDAVQLAVLQLLPPDAERTTELR